MKKEGRLVLYLRDLTRRLLIADKKEKYSDNTLKGRRNADGSGCHGMIHALTIVKKEALEFYFDFCTASVDASICMTINNGWHGAQTKYFY